MSNKSSRAFWDKSLVTLLVLAGITVLAGLAVDMHAHYSFENVPGFYGVFAFVVCGAMTVLAGFVLQPLVKRPADFYDKDRS